MIKKYHNNSWVEIPYRKYDTATDTITTLPADLYADGNNATVGLKGNMSQSSTPTPTNPIQPQECGERTGNLFDISRFSYIGDGAYSINDTTVTMKGNTSASVYYLTGQEYEAGTYIFTFERETSVNCYYVIASDFSLSNCQIDGAYLTMSAPIATKFDKQYAGFKGTEKKSLTITSDVPFYFAIAPAQTSYTISSIMLNTGSTALPYEPYGIKIPISSANTTTPVYLGEVQSTRNIKKVVFKGSENWTLVSGTHGFYTQIGDALDKGTAYIISSHYRASTDSTDGSMRIANNKREVLLFDNYASAAEYKAFLAQQYTAGTPVTIWYVLAEPTTGILNEPLRKIGDYADSVSVTGIPTTSGSQQFDIDTTLKPSEVSLTYTGWHDASAKEKSRNLFDASTIVNKIVYSNGTLANNDDYRLSEFIKVDGNITYSADFATTTHSFIVATYDNSKNFIERFVLNDSSKTINHTGYVRICYLVAQVDNNKVMLNTGSTALPYEPYWT